MSILPFQTKSDFIENVVILSFGHNPPLSPEQRNIWIRERTLTRFQNLPIVEIDDLILLSNTIPTLEKAEEKLREAKAKLKEAKAELKEAKAELKEAAARDLHQQKLNVRMAADSRAEELQRQLDLAERNSKIADMELNLLNLQRKLEIENENATTEEHRLSLRKSIDMTRESFNLLRRSLDSMDANTPDISILSPVPAEQKISGRKQIGRGLNVSFDPHVLQISETNLFAILKSALRGQIHGASPLSSSNADHGKAILKSLRGNDAFLKVEAVEGDRSVLSEAMVSRARDMSLESPRPHERVLVSLYTPVLQRVVQEIDSNIRLINSEEYRWLQASSKDPKCEMKPDLFVAYRGLIEEKVPYNNPSECADARLFGKFPCWNCRSSIWCLFDAKWKIDDEAFGEKCKYLQSCGYNCRIWPNEIPTLKLIIFDFDEFWMIEGGETEVTLVRTCKWSQAGSAQELKTFLTTFDPWMTSTELLLQMLRVQLHHSTPILGAGAYGRAFRLTNGKVLKVTVGPLAAKLEKEYKIIQSIQNNPQTAHFVIPVVPDSFRYCRSSFAVLGTCSSTKE